MSITYELREYFGKSKGMFTDYVLAIADRIDVEHERQLGVLYRDMSDAEWVRLPKDADGEPIHIGDELTDDAEFKSEGVVECLMLDESGWFVGFGKGWTVPSIHEWHHYHAPTVEDVLTEFGIDWEHESDCEDRAALLKEYAAKLRLADVEDA